MADDIITVQGSVSGQSVPANTNLDISIPINVPSGYEIVGSGGYYIDNHVINVSGTRLTNGNSIIICSRNMSSTNYSDITYFARVICKKITS